MTWIATKFTYSDTSTQFKATVDDGGILVCILTNEADNNNFIQVSSF